MFRADHAPTLSKTNQQADSVSAERTEPELHLGAQCERVSKSVGEWAIGKKAEYIASALAAPVKVSRPSNLFGGRAESWRQRRG